MKISCNKLKTYIKNSDKIDWIKVWDLFSIRTAEVEGIEEKGKNIKDVVVAEITSHELHPKKDKYHILKVSDGTKEYDVLCGAPNARKGIKIAYVKVGGMVSGFEIAEKTIAGVLSQGMCCALDELEIGIDHDGILELPSDAPLGMDIKEYFPAINDIVVEIDNKSLTNRPDLWGHYGIAREIAAITGNELLPLEVEEILNDKKDLDIKINNPELCFRFNGLRVDNVTVKETPMDMKIFLYYAGMRSISPLVDISNYLMLELGQPNHAYDANKVKSIEVDLAKDNDTFTTLDNMTRKLTKDNLMIKNEKDYIGIAGVMGGLDSEIESDTTSVLIEAASFDAGSVRKTATSLGLRTEASARFEKSLDPNMTELTIKRFVKVLRDIDPEIEIGSNLTDVYPKPLNEFDINLSKSKLAKYMDIEMKDKDVETILTSLGFIVKTLKDSYKVTVPTYRATKDISIEEDLIEEIARMYGFENIEIKPLKLDLTFTEHENIVDQEYNLKRFLTTKYNLHEVHTYLWYKTSFLNDLEIDKNGITIVDRTADNVLRDDICLSLLEVAKENLKYQSSFGIYELGTIIANGNNKRILSVLIANDANKLSDTYLSLKDIAYNIFKTFKNIEIDFEKSECMEYYQNDLTYAIKYDNKQIGTVKVFSNKVANTIAKKKLFATLEIDFDEFISINKEVEMYKPISKYPTVTLDYTVIVEGKNAQYETLNNILKSFDDSLVNKYELIDTYTTDTETKFTIRYIIGSDEKTLDNKELQSFKDEFIKYIKDNKLNIIE